MDQDGTGYASLRYLSPERLASYGHQLKQTMHFEPDSVLEIGVGAGVLEYLLSQFDVELTTCDYSAELNPDAVADVRELPFADGDFDVVVCCELLEHIPVADLPVAFAELARCSSQGVVVSVPDRRVCWRVDTVLPVIGTRSLMIEDPTGRARRGEPTREHEWELSAGLGLADFVAMAQDAGLELRETYRIPQLMRHRMFRFHKTKERQGTSR